MNIERWLWPQVWERDALEPEILEVDFPWGDSAYEFLKHFKETWTWKPVDPEPLTIRVPAWHPILVDTDNRTFANIRFEAYDETRTDLTPLEKKREAKANFVKFSNENRKREWRHSSFG